MSHDPPLLSRLYKQNLLSPESRSPVPVRLKRNGTLSLGGITTIFTESITEEHAWAVVYGCALALEGLLKGGGNGEEELSLFLVQSPDHIMIHVDGKVHPSTFLGRNADECSDRSPMTSIDEAIAKLGEVIYHTLDYGLTDDDERQLTPGLENLLDLMLSSDSDDPVSEEDPRTVETDDEGIEQDHDECCCSSSGGGQAHHHQGGGGPSKLLSSNISSISRVLSLCTNHLSASKEADHHFKNVCRALVSEALELSFFIERVQTRDSTHAKEIQELALVDWACLWKETMFQLRQGVKLKKTNYTKTPIEYELTPYEILMDDIRSRRFKLNKVMVKGNLAPMIKKDAHDIILDFIRSRPPLKPASRRVLPPKKLDITPQELLMRSICSPSAKASLKKTRGPPSPKKTMLGVEYRRISGSLEEPDGSFRRHVSSTAEKKSTAPLPKRILSSSSLLISKRRNSASSLASGLPEKSRSSGNLKRLIKPDPQFLKFDPYNDDDDEDDDDFFSLPLSPELKPRGSPAGHEPNNTTSCAALAALSPIPSKHPPYPTASPQTTLGSSGIPHRPSQTSTPYLASSNSEGAANPFLSTQDSSILHSQRDESSIFNNCDLSLAELIHIRSVHTKAELEDSPLAPRIKSDLENSKVCFVCMRHYFGFFSWTYKCKLCQKCICSSCMTKIRIPSQDYSKVYLRSLHDSLERGRRKHSTVSPPSSLPLTPTSSKYEKKGVKLRRSNTFRHERAEDSSRGGEGDDGSLFTVCLNCRDIILHPPVSASSSGNNRSSLNSRSAAFRRQHVTRSLCLG